jgi:lipoate synthase
VLGREDGEAREDGDAVPAALVGEVRREGVLHAREARQLRDLIDAVRALDAAIDFLQTDEIDVLAPDHCGDAREVDLLVHARPDVDVVRHDAQRVRARDTRRRGLWQTRRGDADGAEDEERREADP